MTIEAKFHIKRHGFNLDIELSIPSRGITAVFGPSGCGKTTLLRAMAGLENTEQGYLKIGDELWQEGKKSLPTHKRALGYVFQEASLFPHLSVEKNLHYGLKRVPLSQQQVALTDAIDLLGIGHLLARKPAQLSGGERQRVAIARALALSPRLLLMDEPLSALDLKRKQEIMAYLESLHDELAIPIIYVSHAADEVARLADHLVLMEAGKITASGEINAMLTRLDLPVAHDEKALATVQATVTGYDKTYALNTLAFSGGELFSVGQPLPEGQSVRLGIAARDVSLTLSKQPDTSILNILPATVDQLYEEAPAKIVVRLSVGDASLLSRITLKSARELGLEPGKAVYAQVKSIALM